jgi:hypothetical protein
MGIKFSRRILVSITGSTRHDWKSKLHEINRRKIREIALFLEIFDPKERHALYRALKKSCVKSIPLVHAKNDMELREFKLLEKNFGAKRFNVHENSFEHMHKWPGFHHKLYMELNYSDDVPSEVDMARIAGLCVDLSHFAAARDRHATEYDFIMKRRHIKHYFVLNHLNGYNPKTKRDVHTVRSLKEFDYLKKLPKFLFGRYIGLEMFNSIPEQLEFKKHLVRMLNKKFGYS